MARTEWLRETVSTWPSAEQIRERASAGWRLAAIEWEREVPEQVAEGMEGFTGEEIPFGTRIAGDCVHLEANPTEVQVLNLLAEMIVQDRSYKQMAEVLNERGFRTREGKPWTALSVFKLTPRLIEIAPRLLSGAEWENRKKQLSRVAWNS
jgi:Recombinase